MISDFLMPVDQRHAKNAYTIQKGSTYQKGQKEPKRAQECQREPKSAQECPAEINSDFLIPVDQCNAKNAYTIQKGSS